MTIEIEPKLMTPEGVGALIREAEALPDIAKSLPTIGHNRPPDVSEAIVLIRSALLEPDSGQLIASLHDILLDVACADDPARAAERAKLELAVKRWDAERPEIVDDAQAEKAADCMARLGATLKAEDAARTAAKRPYLDGGKKIDATWKRRMAAMDAGLGDNAKRSGLRGRMIRYHDRVRRAAEEARRREQHIQDTVEAAVAGAPIDPELLAAEQAEANRLRDQQTQALIMAQQAAAPTQVRTDHGALTLVQTKYRVEVYDGSAVPDDYWIIDVAAVKAALDLGRDVPGARLVPETIVTVR